MSFRDHPDFEIYMLKETYDKKIEELKQQNKIIQEKYDALVERIIESKLKKKVVMTPEQEEIVEMFRMDL